MCRRSQEGLCEWRRAGEVGGANLLGGFAVAGGDISG